MNCVQPFARVAGSSATATVAPLPNIRAEAICLGNWSTVLALKMLRVRSALSTTRP